MLESKILITGGTGMVGTAFKEIKTDHKIILVGSRDYNLKSFSDVNKMLTNTNPDGIIHLAAKVGGVKGNTDYIADFFHDNILINTNLLKASVEHKIPKVVSLLSTCIYPDKASYPLTEDQIHNGEPHQSNFGYAYAKRMLEVHSRAIRQQYDLKYITAVPNNIYGKNDNFNLNNGHVIPAMIRKFYEAKKNNTNVLLWGSGSPLREFTYSKDIANALLLLLDNYDAESPINIGLNREISIKKLADLIAKKIEFHGKIIWEKNKPEGQIKKPSSNKKFLDMFPNFCYTDLSVGLKETIEWFDQHYPNIRGTK
jgi:GDP-L-fucose synthase